MATVYRGHDKRLGRDVAIKVIHRHLRENKEVAARFASEARAVAKVKHPNIVEVYDVSDERDPERYLVVELIRGFTLRKVLVEHGHLPAEIAAAIAIQVARGLNHAHQQGVVHRDVKPENVLVETSVRVDASTSAEYGKVRIKITDFGIAKLLDAQGVTSTGQVLGSPAHMAPEQIEGGDVSARSDVFGLGVLLYESMVGSLPFEGKNPAQVLRRVLDGSFTPAERACPSVGARWSRIVDKALAHKSEDRFPSAGDLADALQQELTALGFSELQTELDAFFKDSEAYQEAYVPRVVERLKNLGREARQRREMPRAAALFNRALAFRPDNTGLLAEVAGLARRQRLQRSVRNVALVGASLASVLVLVYVLFGKLEVGRSPATQPSAGAKAKAEQKAVASSKGVAAEPPAPRASAASKGRRPADKPRPRPRLARPLPAESAAEETAVDAERDVRIVIDGPQSASVRIDGQQRAWYQPQKLSVGPHTFEFIPPNTECCEHPAPRTVEVVVGEGVQVVKGTIPFKPAILSLEAPPGAKASCGVAGQLLPGQSKQIELDDASLAVRCHVIPPPDRGGSPKEIDVALSPGRTFSIAWP
jgi:serine/threonine-protein kinase